MAGVFNSNQPPIQYDYLNTEGKVVSTRNKAEVIENERNVWLHPPRGKYFKILELNPFPFIQAPYQIGNEWGYSLTIGSSWGDLRWKTWEGVIENRCSYKITAYQQLSLGLWNAGLLKQRH